jgi:class 3 adenylate cyclase/tetratricopeptide (TPR) repeat protein
MTENPSGTKTILFTDVEGSTNLRTRVGDDAAHTVLREHEETIRDLIASSGGREVKSLGDGFMAAFVSARSAVDCAVAIQRAFEAFGEEGLRVRVGVNAGDVREEAGDLYGSAVNAAARIAAAANGRQILVSGVVKDLAGTMPGVEFVDRGLFWLKGFPEKWRLHEVQWSAGRTRTPSPLAPLDRTPLAGREEEMADLRRLLDQALAGRGALVLIGGEPGLGKTRLAEEILEEASGRGFLALTGRCYEMEGAPPYMPLVEILHTAAKVVPPEVFREALGDAAGEVARLLPELGRLFADIPAPVDMPPEQARRYLLNSLRDFFDRTSRRRPLVLLLDDLHWADESSLLLLQHTAERLADMPALIIGTYRDVELDVGRPLAMSLDWLLRHRLAHRVALHRLGEDGIREMLTGLAGQAPPDALVKVIYSETEGNPFFVEEVFRHLSEEGRLLNEAGGFRADLVIDELDVPEGVRLVIGRRLQRLEEDTRKLLSAAAVLGRSFEYELVRAMDGLSDDQVLDAVEEAERARLIVPAGAGSRYFFGHELIRQTLLSGLSLPRRQRLHLRAAEAIETTHFVAGDAAASDLAHHLFQAGAAADAEKTVRALALAGEVAMRTMAFDDALRHFDNAVAVEPDGADTRASLLHGRARALRSLGRWDEALDAWREALALAEAAGDHEATGQMAWELAHQLAWATRWQEAAETAARGLAGLGDAQTPERAQLTLLCGIAFGLGGNGAFGWQMIEEGTALAERLGDDRLIGYARYCQTAYHWAYWNAEACVQSGRRAIEPLRASGDLWDLAALLGFIDFMLFALGRIDEALPVARESLELCQRLGHRGAELLPARTMAYMELFFPGRWDEFEAYLERDIEICLTIESPFVRDDYTWKGMLAHIRGDWAEALHWFERGAEQTVPGVWAPIHPMFLARHLARLGDADRARELLEARVAFLPRPDEGPVSMGSWVTLSLSVETLVEVGEEERAAELYPLTLDYVAMGSFGQPYDYLPAEFCAGLAASAGRRWDEAEGHYHRALEQATAIGNRPADPEVRYRLAAMLLKRSAPGDRESAARLLGEAIERYRGLGMPKHVELAEGMLQRAQP